MRAHRRLIALGMGAALLVAACGGSSGGGGGGAGSSSPSPTPTGGVVDASAAPSAAASAGSGGAGPDSTTNVDLGGEGGLPDDACQVVSESDVQGIFGGDVSSDGLDDDDNCVFTVKNGNGFLEAQAEVIDHPVLVGFTDSWISYEDEKAVFGDGVQQVDGLGTDAWLGLGAIHARIPGGELVVSGVFGEVYDQAVVVGELKALTKLILGRI